MLCDVSIVRHLLGDKHQNLMRLRLFIKRTLQVAQTKHVNTFNPTYNYDLACMIKGVKSGPHRIVPVIPPTLAPRGVTRFGGEPLYPQRCPL